MNIEYKVTVDNLLVGGHPIQYLEFNLMSASRIFDDLHKKYPHNTVRLFSISTKEVMRLEGKARISPICPRGHGGKDWNKRDVVTDNGRGAFICSVCGWVGEETDLKKEIKK